MSALSLADESRRGELDSVVDPADVHDATADEVFAIADEVRSSSALRRALTDPSVEPGRKQAVVRQLFGPHVGEQAVAVAERAVGLRWPGASAFLAALEREGIRLALCGALKRGTLDDVGRQLHEFGGVVQATPELQAAVADERVPLSAREDLVTRLLDGRADPVTVRLARRALAWNDRVFVRAIDSMLVTAADLKGQTLARVTVARALDPAQEERLRSALEKQAGRPIDLQVTVDPEVVGGVRVALGDQVIEGTISNKLTELERSFG